MFTPQLAELYKKLSATRSDFEVVFVSSDRDEEAFKENHNEMPWLALPHSNRDGKNAVSNMFEVEGIPSFVMIDPSGKTINAKARGTVSSDLEEGKNFPCAPKPVEEVEALGWSLKGAGNPFPGPVRGRHGQKHERVDGVACVCRGSDGRKRQGNNG
eukprot:2774853-Rhodomonas_salina.1